VLGAHLYSIAAPDGLTLGMPGRAGFVLPAATGDPNARFDLTKFAWIGSSASTNYILWLRKDQGLTSLDALRKATKQVVIGGAGTNTANAIVPEVLAKYEHLPIKVIRGYPGTVDVVQAIEHNEVHGIFAHRASVRPDMITSGFVVPLFQTFPLEKDLPAVEDFVSDPEEKAILGLLNAPLKLGLPLIAPPATPPEVVAILREAYLKMAASPEYQEAASKQGFDVGRPNTGAELEDYARAKLAAVPEAVLKQYRALVDR
jgi:tripartite-type tricarboxylate transporter receptor subunit TctC